MEQKICKKCNIQKNIIDFYFLKNRKNYDSICKECKKKYVENYRKANKDKVKEYRKKYFKIYRSINKDKISEQQKIYRNENKEKSNEYAKKYRLEHKEYFLNYQREYYKKNREIICKKRRKKDKKIADKSMIKLKAQIRSLISKSFARKKFIKEEKTENIIGCNFDFFYKYLLQTFSNNYGYKWNGIEKIHIDHIIPLSTANSKDEVLKLCHYTNLQLLKANDNLKKSNKLNWKIM